MTKKEEVKVKVAKNEKIVFDRGVREQHYPVYNVVLDGVTVEWTDHFNDAMSAYKETDSRFKQLWKLHAGGHAELVYARSI